MRKKTTLPSDNIPPSPAQPPAASFFRLLGTWLYDTLLLFAVWLLAVILYMIPAQVFIKLDSTNTNNLTTSEFIGPFFFLYLFLVSWFFFAWFWTHGGQTLGLRTWSLKLQTQDGNSINWTQSLLRFLVAGTPWLAALFLYSQLSKTQLMSPPYLYGVFLIGFSGLFWTLIDREKRSLQDIFSGTRIIKMQKNRK